MGTATWRGVDRQGDGCDAVIVSFEVVSPVLLPHGANTAMAVPAGRQGKKTNVVVCSSRPWNIFSVDQLRLVLAASVSDMLLTISFVSLSFLVVPYPCSFPFLASKTSQPANGSISLSTDGSDSLPGLVRATALAPQVHGV